MASANLHNTSDNDFENDVLNASTPVLVDFWATWCGPCRTLTPHLEKLADEFDSRLKVVKLNIDDHREVTMRYGVTSIPALLLFKNGEVVDKMIGNPGRYSPLKELVDPHV